MEAGPIRNTSPGTATAIAMAKPIAPPRPPNAWILYRSDKLRELPPAPPGERRAQSDVSRLISTMWKQETDATRQYYERLADEKKQEHSIKYPGYRFQPMKKEEKAAMREQKKVEKEAERKARQQRGRQSQQHNPYPQPPQQQVQVVHSTLGLQLLSTPPLLYLPSPPNPSLYPPQRPGSIYYPMELYGSAGPSPPASLASTPTPEPSPELTPDEPYEVRNPQQPPSATVVPPLSSTFPPLLAQPPVVLSHTPAPVPSGVNPYLAVLGPAATQYSNSQMVQPTSVPTYGNPTHPAAMPNMTPSTTTNLLQFTPNQYSVAPPNLGYSQNVENQELAQSSSGADSLAPDTNFADNDTAQELTFGNDPMPQIYDYEGLEFPPFENQQLTFNVGDNFFQSMSSLLEGGSDSRNTLEAMRLGNDVFQLPHFDATLLDEHPQGEVVVELGQFADEFDFNSFIDTGMLDSGSVSSANNSCDYGQRQSNSHPEIEALPQPLFELIQASLASAETSPSTASYPSMPPTPVVGPGALSVDLSNTEPCRKSSSPHYAPPSGAPQFAARRVAGSWKPPRFVENEEFDHPPSVRNSVGVSR